VETNSQAPIYIRIPGTNSPREPLLPRQKVEVQTNAQPVELFGELSAACIADIHLPALRPHPGRLDEYTLASKAKAMSAGKR
jgi:hypothetical protein